MGFTSVSLNFPTNGLDKNVSSYNTNGTYTCTDTLRRPDQTCEKGIILVWRQFGTCVLLNFRRPKKKKINDYLD